VCCFNVGSTTYGDCDERIGTGPAAQDVYDFIGSESVWLTAFHESWTMATENGYTTLYAMEIGDDVDDVVTSVSDGKKEKKADTPTGKTDDEILNGAAPETSSELMDNFNQLFENEPIAALGYIFENFDVLFKFW
jgi:hypothetical protein